jgi:hypothetical protein
VGAFILMHALPSSRLPSMSFIITKRISA